MSNEETYKAAIEISPYLTIIGFILAAGVTGDSYAAISIQFIGALLMFAGIKLNRG